MKNKKFVKLEEAFFKTPRGRQIIPWYKEWHAVAGQESDDSFKAELADAGMTSAGPAQIKSGRKLLHRALALLDDNEDGMTANALIEKINADLPKGEHQTTSQVKKVFTLQCLKSKKSNRPVLVNRDGDGKDDANDVYTLTQKGRERLEAMNDDAPPVLNTKVVKEKKGKVTA